MSEDDPESESVTEGESSDEASVGVDQEASDAAGEESSTDDGSEESPTDDGSEDAEELEEVGDGREKHVKVLTRAGKEFDHGSVFLRHSETEFVVAPDTDFSPEETTRYRKEDLARVEVTQHHSACFITTATAGEGPTLSALRGFRDDVMSPSTPGRALLTVYDAVSPPVAATLARHPDATGTRAVRSLVERCGSLATRRRTATPAGRAGLSILLVACYVVGVCLALAVHGWLTLREGRVS